MTMIYKNIKVFPIQAKDQTVCWERDILVFRSFTFSPVKLRSRRDLLQTHAVLT